MPINAPTKDGDIRSALHNKCLRSLKSHPDTLVIDELGLAHAKSRIDVAVINGCIHGYEIKSAKDSLHRFEKQLEIYRQTLQKLTVVVDAKHLEEMLSLVPSWCGILEAIQGPRGGIRLKAVRPAGHNPDIDLVMMSHLLWRSEVHELLTQMGYSAKELRQPRKYLYELLCKSLTPSEIAASIRKFMMQRQTWRDRPTPGAYGD